MMFAANSSRAQASSRLTYAAALLLLAFSVLTIASCTPKKKGVIEVGDRYVSESLFGKRAAQMKLMFPNITRTQVATQLVEGLAANHVLEKHGMAVTREELMKERDEIRSNPEIRDLFMEVQRLYGAAGEDFLDIGLLPDVSVRELHQKYETGQIEYGLREVAEQILRESQPEADRFAEIATEHGASVQRLTVNAQEATFRTAAGDKLDLAPKDNLRRQFTQNLALASQEIEGEAVLGVITQTRRGYMLTKLLSGDGHMVEIEAAFLERPDFHEWFIEQTESLRVCVHDERLLRNFDSQARTIKVNCD